MSVHIAFCFWIAVFIVGIAATLIYGVQRGGGNA